MPWPFDSTTPRRRTRACLILLLAAALGDAQQPDAGHAPSADLAKQLSNPIASLVSIPFQFNWEQSVGPEKLTRFVLNVQPVMPFSLGKNLNLIVRAIVPFIGQPPLTGDGAAATGMSDITTSFFFSPSTASHFTWGAGPVVVLPSTSEPTLGSGRWSAGPTIIALEQSGHWTIGALWNQAWSFAGDDRRPPVSQMFVQPFASYQATHTITLTLQSESTASWNAPHSGDRWTIPVNFSVSKLSTFGTFPASYQFGGGVFVARAEGAPAWKLRAAIVVLMPRR